MKTKIIIFILVLFLGISGVVVLKSFADNNPVDSVIDNDNKLQTSGSKPAQNISFNVTDNDTKSSNLSVVADIVKDYTYDNDIYSCMVFEYPDRIDISKHFAYGTANIYRISYLPDRSKLHRLLVCDITENTAENLKNLPIMRSSVINDNIKYIVYDAVGLNGKKIELNVLFANGFYFEICESPFLDVKKIADNTYMVIYKELGQVNYIHTDNSKIVSEVYMLPMRWVTTGTAPVYPKSGKILTDNIIRLEWKDGAIEHWKVRLTKDDIEKNKEYGLKQGFKNTEKNVFLWWNGVGRGCVFVNHTKDKAWDYNEDTSTEPTYK